jgi:hypothetical protein
MTTEPNNRLPPEVRYHRDLQFHQLVDALTQMIINAEYTPTELREAVIFAAIRYENTRMEAYQIDPNDWRFTEKK